MLEGLEAMGNKVSRTKTFILGSTAEARLILHNMMSSAGWDLQGVVASKDLGADTSMALRRTAKTRSARMKSASARAAMIRQLC